MKKLALASALLSSLAFVGTAHAYQAEVNGGYDYQKFSEGEGHTNGFNVGGKYYFEQVEVRNYPLAEAAFLNRASNVNGGVTYSKNGDLKDTGVGVGVEYFVPNSDFYTSANVRYDELRFNSDDKTKTYYYGAEVGYLPISGLLIAAGVQGYDTRDGGGNGAHPTLRAKLVTDLDGHDINLEARGVFAGSDNQQYSAKADYYIDKTLSVGADFERFKAQNVNQWGITANKFLTQDISVNARAGFGTSGYKDTYSIGAAYRF